VEFGIIGANVGPFAGADGARALGRACEAAGFDSVWTFEHVVAPAGYESRYPYASSGRAPGLEQVDLPDPLIWLTYVGAVTERLRLGTGILILPQRNPLVLAKELASLDALTGGRVILGVGAGWLREEFEALGVPFERRGARTDEYIKALRVLWTGEQATFHGEFVDFTHCISLPRPARGTVPITVGGHSEAAARRAGRFGDGYFPAVDAATIGHGGADAAIDRLTELIELARRTAEEYGRDPAVLEISVNWGRPPKPDVVARLADIGVHRIAMFAPSADLANLDEHFGEVAARLRAGAA
jgi:probable F420-dependent oxidoreductase